MSLHYLYYIKHTFCLCSNRFTLPKFPYAFPKCSKYFLECERVIVVLVGKVGKTPENQKNHKYYLFVIQFSVCSNCAKVNPDQEDIITFRSIAINVKKTQKPTKKPESKGLFVVWCCGYASCAEFKSEHEYLTNFLVRHL